VIGDLRATVAAFAGAGVVLAVVLAVVGVGDVLAAVGRARPVVVLAVVGVALGWLLCWGLALRTVLGVLGTRLSVGRSFLVFSAATFANNVTPFGQAGGEPFSALLVSRVADSEYETGLAAVASVDALHFLPSVGLALVGLGYYGTTVAFGDRLAVAAVGVGGFAAAVAVGGSLGWRYREAVERAVVGATAPLFELLGRLAPGRAAPARAAVADRVGGFFETVERIAGDRRALVTALALSALGWVGLAGSLWLSLFALGHPVALAAPLVAIPLGSMASVTPLPGGLGGIEAVLVALLVPTTGLAPATVGAAVLVHRGATYWLPVVVGGAAASAVGASEEWG
jgi:uncharacterized protein (TIRG00374 family)